MKKRIGQYMVILLGVILTSFAIGVFYTPNKIVSGGVSGLSTILYHTLHIPLGISFAVINAAFLLLALKFIGREFVIKTIAGAGLMSLFVQIFSYIPPITDDMVLASVFGAVLYGSGIGLTLINGASTGGTDILSRLLQLVFQHVKIGKLLLAVDAAVILMSLIVFKTADITLWGIAALFVSTFAVDWIIRKLNVSKLAFVVTSMGAEVAKTLVSSSPRGVTLVETTGAYTLQNNNMLICALKENELPEFQKNVLEVDGKAFIIYAEAQQIVGNGFHLYK